MKTISKSTKHSLFLLLTFVLLLINLYAVKVFIIFGSPPLFAISLFVEVILLGAFVYSLWRLLTLPTTILKSLLISIIGGLASNVYVQKITRSQNRYVEWAKRRLVIDSPYGLPLTITILIAAFFFMNFISVLMTVVSKGSLTQVDTRILNEVPNIRTPLQDTFFRTVTMLGNAESIILLIVLTTAILWRKNQKVLAGFILGMTVLEECIAYMFKLLIHRMRPDHALAILRESGYSFPSGHAFGSTVFFGLIAYLLYKSFISTRARLLIIGLYIVSVFLVIVSRVYLGVHYPSDVWAGVLLGSSLLTLAIGAIEIASRYEVIGHKKIIVPNKSIILVPGVLIVFAILATPYFIPIQLTKRTQKYTTLSAINESTIHQIPLYSEGLTGSRMEPINFIYVGSEEQIIQLFKSHGWEKADPSTLSNTLRAFAVGFQGRQYMTAPVTPSYLNYQPENIAFEKSTTTHSLRQRHHTRLWRTNYDLPNGQSIWVATASFDEGVEFAGAAKLPTHHIDPNVDGERAYIVQSLGLPGNLMQVVQPQSGKNASGDAFFTDGKAELVGLH